tara:strand:+ start:716 stop:1072 length:357 start_codon:yes stop_codon:yes gene_type:complete
MQVSLLKSKLHRVTVTAVEPDYSGSITIDGQLMEAAGFLIHEKVLVGNINNGERFETYVIPGEEGSGEIALNGAAAHKGNIGDLLVILSFVLLDQQEAKSWEPRVVIADAENRVRRKD